MQPILVQCDTFRAITWEKLPARLATEPVVIYKAQITDFSPVLPFLKSLLRPEEVMRAGRYHQHKDQDRFIVARGLLRMLLGHYTGLHPTEVEFLTGINKKPTLKGFASLHYNVTHSGNWILIAISTHQVGIDVEEVSADFRYTDLLSQSFAADERRYINDSELSRLSFYQLWTRKEALTKATAKGVDDDFCRIPSLAGSHRVASELIHSADNWRVSTFDVGTGYVASVAYAEKMTDAMIRFYEIDRGLIDTLA